MFFLSNAIDCIKATKSIVTMATAATAMAIIAMTVPIAVANGASTVVISVLLLAAIHELHAYSCHAKNT